jgi:hypothetical protein
MTLSLKAIDRDDHEYDTRDGEIARRNVLFGLWAGQRMGLEGDAIEAYAWSVHLADSDRPGHDDVIAKVATDLACRGKPLSDRQLRSYLQEMAMRASLGLAQSYPAAVMGGRG